MSNNLTAILGSSQGNEHEMEHLAHEMQAQVKIQSNNRYM